LLGRGADEDEDEGSTPAPDDPPSGPQMSGYSNVTSAQMKVIQSQLTDLGYYTDTVDGRYGTNTENAVREFQTSAGLTVDGKPGKNTRAALAEATGSEFDVEKMPSIDSDEVGFNMAMTEFKEGVQWRYVVLDIWLNNRRRDGLLETKFAEISSQRFVNEHPDYKDTAAFWEQAGLVGTGVGWAGVTLGTPVAVKAALIPLVGLGLLGPGLALGTVLVAQLGAAAWVQSWIGGSGGDPELIQSSGAYAAKRFMESHSVVVNGAPNPVKISDLPNTQAVVDFKLLIFEYISRFQSSQYSG